MEPFRYEGTVFCSDEEAARCEEEGIPFQEVEDRKR
jgi:hypothetical protein